MRSRRLFALLLVFAMMLSLSACASREIAVEDAEPDEETSDALNSDEPEAEPSEPTDSDEPDEKASTERIYAAYREIVRERERTYGIGARSLDRPDSEICWMYGVACVRLRDLDGDGVEELLLWENTLVNNFPAAAQIEVWTYEDGAAKELYRGFPCVGGDPSGQSLEFWQYQGEPLLVTGEAGGYLNLEYYALRDGAFVLVHTLRMSDTNNDEYYFDGEAISSDEAWDMAMETESLCNACVMTTADAADILRETEQTRITLGM